MSRHFAEIPQDAWYSGQDLSNSSDNAAWFPGITSQTLAPEPYSTGTQPGIDPEDTSFVEDAKFGEEQDVHGNPAEPMTSAVLIDPNLDYDHLPGEFSDLHRADVTSSEFQFLMNSDSEPRFPELNYQEYQPGNQRMPLYKPAHSESAEWNTTNVPYSLPPPRMDRSAQDHQRGLELDNPDSYGRETGAGQLSLRSLPGIGYVSDSTANGNIYFGNLLSPGPAPSRGSSSRFWPSSYHESDQSFLQNPPDRLQASYDTLAFPLLEDSGPASQVFKPERAAEVFEFDSGRSLPIDSFSAAHAHRRQIKHRVTNSLVPHEVDTRPDIYIKQLHSAMMDMDDAKDGQRKTVTGVDKRPSQGYVKLSKDPNYETDAWAASWMVLEKLISLHREGCSLHESHHKKDKDDGRRGKRDNMETDLAFNERFVAVVEILRIEKNTCLKIIRDGDVECEKIVCAPNKRLLQKQQWRITNDKRDLAKRSAAALPETSSRKRRRASQGSNTGD